YPTMLYETLMAIAIFAILWLIRKHPFRAGWLFSLYLVFNGIERFLIEIIRLNPQNYFGLTQAQLIAIGLVLVGLTGVAITSRKMVSKGSEVAAEEPSEG
ncbi:MAG: prolipoprotein diacylglyceryl transferase, partial [Rubricoccaceae bacterium]|nr:prolipoprotein diacylglyceryl transferase [Rubricoccaceae bacterium]